MRFGAAFAVGVLFGLFGVGVVAVENSLESMFGLVIALVVVPVVGSLLSGLGAWANVDPEEERPADLGRGAGRAGAVAGGLFLGMIAGIVVAVGLGS
jgi:hypothetical protein